MQKEVILMLIATVIMAFGQYFMKIGMNAFTTVPIYLNFKLILGLILYCLVSIIVLIVLKRQELSKIYPILALSYLWVNLVAIALLKESITLLSWIGTVLIIGGIALMSKK